MAKKADTGKKAAAKVAQEKGAESGGQGAIDIEDFFTTTREAGGVWRKVTSGGVDAGIELKVLGRASPKFAEAMAAYDGAGGPGADLDTERKAEAAFLSVMVADVRAAAGKSARFHGRALSYSREAVKEIMYELDDARREFIDGILTSSLFIG